MAGIAQAGGSARFYSEAELGSLVATALAGAWRTNPGACALPQSSLEAAAPLLFGTGSAALAWWRLRDREPELGELGAHLRGVYQLFVLRTREGEARIVRVLSALRAAGVEALLVKGWSNASLYPAVGLRPPGDVDLVVPPDQEETCRRVLAELGETVWTVDVHVGTTRLVDREFGDLFARSRERRLGSTAVRVPAPEDQLRLNCLHLLKHGAWRPVWLTDVAAQLESLPAEFDWDLFLGGTPHRRDWMIAVLSLAARLLGADLSSIPSDCRTVRLPDWLEPAVLNEWGGTSRWPTRETAVRAALTRPTSALRELRRRWPNPIEATCRYEGRFDDRSRLPFQARLFVRRLPQVARQVARLVRRLLGGSRSGHALTTS